jgi:hypothetical protein
VLLYHRQNAGQNHNIKVANRSPEICGTVQIFADDSDESKLDSDEINYRESG